MACANVKQQVHELVDQPPENAAWDGVVYQMVVRREIRKGLTGSDAGLVPPLEDVMQEFGMTE